MPTIKVHFFMVGFFSLYPLLFKITVKENDAFSLNDNDQNNRSGFYHNWIIKRHPRTAIGLNNEGIVFITVVYGRKPKKSVGGSITEISKLTASLGYHEAFNLDGGGSSMMIVGNKKMGESSNINGERPVEDVLLLLSK